MTAHPSIGEPIPVLVELFERLGARNGSPVLLNTAELGQWPGEAATAMKKQRLIVKARTAASAACPGCERGCVMPVHTLPAATTGRTLSFIVCDKRSDMNRVPVPPEALRQWQCTADLVSAFISSEFGLRSTIKQSDDNGRWEIGMVCGDKRSQMLCLETSGTLNLVVETSRVPLAELIEFHDGAYSLDAAPIRRLVDAATTADNRYTPSNARIEARKLKTQAKYEEWRKAYRALRKRRPERSDAWCSQQIATMDIAQGRDAETIRKKMKG